MAAWIQDGLDHPLGGGRIPSPMAQAFHGHARRSGPIITSKVVHLSTAFSYLSVDYSAAFYMKDLAPMRNR